MTTHGDAYLQHYGVKGMKWGVRKPEEHAAMLRSEARDWRKGERINREQAKTMRTAGTTKKGFKKAKVSRWAEINAQAAESSAQYKANEARKLEKKADRIMKVANGTPLTDADRIDKADIFRSRMKKVGSAAVLAGIYGAMALEAKAGRYDNSAQIFLRSLAIGAGAVTVVKGAHAVIDNK